ncbi:MAG: SH3 domain-containing protein [Thiofilum sp.]|uniref:COG3650 family protein n=1 Tax=Thiofilum sp. TaxID=2212733 RepID=UPI0025E804D1|nr:SH3 domain-containing protein [Thiofilum sp.]MBK8452682.1 SH3 domain-containing protein [Thiofilum sp.]
MRTLTLVLAAALSLVTHAAQAAPFNVYTVNASDGLNLRAEPSANAEIRYNFPKGTQVISNGTEKKVGSATWVQVHFYNFEGWVNKKYLTPTMNLNRLGATTSKATERLQCSGTEPFWGFKFNGKTVQGESMKDDTKYRTTVTKRSATRDQTTTVVEAGKLAFLIQKTGQCSDGMSDIVYPYAVEVMLPNKTFLSGCCR